jgi:hypothetical protein
LTLWVPRPSVPALLTSAAEPEDIDSTCVKLRVFSGTAVIVLPSTSVPVDGAPDVTLHSHATTSDRDPRSRVASRAATSDTFTVIRGMREVLKPRAEKRTSYSPGASSEKRYEPPLSALLVCF